MENKLNKDWLAGKLNKDTDIRKPQEPMEWESEFEKEFKGEIAEYGNGGGNPMDGFDYPYSREIKKELKHFISSQIKQAEERGEKRIIDRINYELDIAESDKESADNPEDPRVRINYFRALLKDLINQNNE